MARNVGPTEEVGNSRRNCAREKRLVAATFAAASVITSAVVTAAATWAATAMVIGTTYTADPAEPRYLHGAMEYYIQPTTMCGAQACTPKPVITPEQFWPSTGWSDMTIDQSISQGVSTVNDALLRELANEPDAIVVFGNSQSASILTLEKRDLAGLQDAQKDRLAFVLVANPNRPNGGLLERIAPVTIPIIGLTGTGPTPTDSGINTIDIAFQYDGVSDFPQYPLNIVAVLNVIVGGAQVHNSYMTGPLGYTEEELFDAITDPANRQTHGDTTYITIPAKQLPLLVPFRQFGEMTGLSLFTAALADLTEPILRVVVELGYDRSISYGEPTKFGLIPSIDPAELASELAAAAAEGVDAALTDLGFSTRAAPSSTPVSRRSERTIVSTARAAHRMDMAHRRSNQTAANSFRTSSPTGSAHTDAQRYSNGQSARHATRLATPRNGRPGSGR